MSNPSVELASAFITLVPSMRGSKAQISKELGEQVQPAADSEGQRSGGMLATGMKKGLKVGLGGGALLAGIGAKKGWDRLLGLENAEASLKGLGFVPKEIARIRDDALGAVDGTAFGVQEAMSSASAAIGTGVKPGQDLERYLKLTGDAAANAQVDFGAMAQMMNKVQGSGRLTGDVLQQMSDNNFHVLPMLSEAMGKTTDEIRDMVSNGEISAAQFQEVLEGKIGGAALAMGDTTTGAWKNMWASIGRVFANFLSGVFPKIKGVMQEVTDVFRGVEKPAIKVGSAVGSFFSLVGRGVSTLWSLRDVIVVATAGYLAYRTALIAVTIATKAKVIATTALWMWQKRAALSSIYLTMATRGLTGAMRANPIGAVVTALTLLAAAGVYAFNKFPGFRAVVLAVWSGIKTAFSAAWSFIQPVFSAIASWVGAALPKVFGVLKTVIGVAFKVIGTYIRTWWTVVKAIFSAVKWYVTTVVGPIFSWLWNNIIKPIFGWIGRRISQVWSGVIKPVFSAFRTGVSKIGSAFGAAKSAISRAWGGLGKVVSGPIDAAKRVISGFINLINKIPGVEIPNPFGGGKKKANTTSGRRNGHRGATAYATGGRVLGAGGPTADKIPAWLSNGEHVLTAADVKALGGHARVEAMRAAAKNGQFHIPGFAKGGRVVGYPISNNHGAGYYGATSAWDAAAPTGSPVWAWKAGRVAAVNRWGHSYGNHVNLTHGDGTWSRYAHLSSIAVKQGARVAAQALIGKVGSTGNSTGPHLHFESHGGAYTGGGPSGKGGGGSIWDTLKGAAGKISDWIKDKLTSKANIGGLFGNVSGLFSTIGNGVKKHVTDKLFDSGGLAGGKGLMVKNTLSPERVLSPRQTAAFEAALARGFGPAGSGGGSTLHVVEAVLDEDRIRLLIEESLEGDEADADQMLNMTPAGLRY